MDYRFGEARRTLAFGKFQDAPLTEARNMRKAARQLRGEGTDPGQSKNDEEHIGVEIAGQTFGKLARAWYGNKLSTWCESTAKAR